MPALFNCVASVSSFAPLGTHGLPWLLRLRRVQPRIAVATFASMSSSAKRIQTPNRLARDPVLFSAPCPSRPGPTQSPIIPGVRNEKKREKKSWSSLSARHPGRPRSFPTASYTYAPVVKLIAREDSRRSISYVLVSCCLALPTPVFLEALPLLSFSLHAHPPSLALASLLVRHRLPTYKNYIVHAQASRHSPITLPCTLGEPW